MLKQYNISQSAVKHSSATSSNGSKGRGSRGLMRNNPKVALSRANQQLYNLPPLVRTPAVGYKP